MKRMALFLLIFCALASAQAQTYFGVGGARLISSSSSVPLVSVQVGGRAAPEFGHLEVRAALDTLLLFSDLSLDAFASAQFPDASLRVYFGGGPDMLIFAPLDSVPGQERSLVSFGLHGTLGLEFFSKAIRPFTELQPAAAFLYGVPVFGLKARAGVNVYF